MAPNRIKKACNAMKIMDIPEEKVMPVLNQLLKTYCNTWKFIEAERYKLLVEAILDQDQESEQKEGKKEESNDVAMTRGKKRALEQTQLLLKDEEDDSDEDVVRLKIKSRRKLQSGCDNNINLSLGTSPSKNPIEDEHTQLAGKEADNVIPEDKRERGCDNIMDHVQCDGAALLYEDKIGRLGIILSEYHLHEIESWLCYRDSTSLSTDSLQYAGLPKALSLSDSVSGMAAVRGASQDMTFLSYSIFKNSFEMVKTGSLPLKHCERVISEKVRWFEFATVPVFAVVPDGVGKGGNTELTVVALISLVASAHRDLNEKRVGMCYMVHDLTGQKTVMGVSTEMKRTLGSFALERVGIKMESVLEEITSLSRVKELLQRFNLQRTNAVSFDNEITVIAKAGSVNHNSGAYAGIDGKKTCLGWNDWPVGKQPWGTSTTHSMGVGGPVLVFKLSCLSEGGKQRRELWHWLKTEIYIKEATAVSRLTIWASELQDIG